jgi:DNA-binding SARP family transcriptional activator
MQTAIHPGYGAIGLLDGTTAVLESPLRTWRHSQVRSSSPDTSEIDFLWMPGTLEAPTQRYPDKPERRRDRGGPAPPVVPLRVGLLGGFRVQRVDLARSVSSWQRRSGKTLTKLLATCPGHTLHREQVVEILWPGADVESGLNSFGKALHAARHALEPELAAGSCSAYLRLTDAMVVLDTEHVAIDADRFQSLAEDALRRRDITAYESALAAYGGELLPEDRYEDWCAGRRSLLAELHVRLLLGLADALEGRGAYTESEDRLREVLQLDLTREEVHRRLMRLYTVMGSRDQAIRQFHICREVLLAEFDLAPQPETVSLYEDVLANRIPKQGPPRERNREKTNSHLLLAGHLSAATRCLRNCAASSRVSEGRAWSSSAARRGSARPGCWRSLQPTRVGEELLCSGVGVERMGAISPAVHLHSRWSATPPADRRSSATSWGTGIRCLLDSCHHSG